MTLNFPWYVWLLIAVGLVAAGYFSSMAMERQKANKLANKGKSNLHAVTDEETEEEAVSSEAA